VRCVINNIWAKNIFCHMVVSSSSRRKILLAVEYELIAVCSHTSCHSHTSHLEGKDVTVLLLTVLQELDGLPIY
jgi:hypothetical protein